MRAKVLALARQYVTVHLAHYDLVRDHVVSDMYIPGEALLRDDILRQDARTQQAPAETLVTYLAQLHTVPQSALDQAGIQPSATARIDA